MDKTIELKNYELKVDGRVREVKMWDTFPAECSGKIKSVQQWHLGNVTLESGEMSYVLANPITEPDADLDDAAFAFTCADETKMVSIVGDKVTVDGKLRPVVRHN